ncbi:MAG: prolyl oligopeptidase family serine peptidase [Myxococcota bacterium]
MRQSILLLLALALGACGEDESTLKARLQNLGVSTRALFAPPSSEELSASRTARPRDRSPDSALVLETRVTESGDSLRVVSHRVDGELRYGAIYVPADASELTPVLVSSIGFGPPFELPLDGIPGAGFNGTAISAFPAFRGHTLRLGEQSWVAEGERFDQCDGGTEDALHFLEVVFALEPLADPERVIFAGGSRGGNVSMIAALRDDRIDRVASIAGPTSYLVEEFADNPNLRPLYENWFVRDLLDGSGSVAAARARMIACSPLYFIDELPPTQLHHGTADVQVPLRSATDFIAARDSQGIPSERLEVFLYEGEGHSFSTRLQEVNARIIEFSSDLFLGVNE